MSVLRASTRRLRRVLSVLDAAAAGASSAKRSCFAVSIGSVHER